MQPNSEPTPADVAAVSAHLTGQPASETAPQPQMQPTPPTPQPAPSQAPADPFAQLFASEPATPEPQNQPAPQSATPPVEPASQPVQQPEPSQSAPQQQTATETHQDDYQTYEEYMSRVMANVPQAPSQPDPEKIDPNDPAAIKGFFDDLVNTAVQRSNTEIAKKQAIQTAERQAWDNAFEKYGSLRTNKQLRDTVHTIRMGYFQRGIALTPTQAADKLLESLGQERRAGAAGAQVVTTYEQVQPNSGGSGAPVPTSLDTTNILESVQAGGETALAEILDKQIKAGKTW